jgi:xylulokinase
VLIGGGARSDTWRQVVRRLSGRAVLVPDETELVAVGAAVQAAATLHGQAPETVASTWNTSAGTLLEPMARDLELIELHRRVRSLAIEAVQSRS